MNCYFFRLKFLVLVLFTFISGKSLSFLPTSHAVDYIDFYTFLQLPKEDQRQVVLTGQKVLANIEQEQVNHFLKKNKYKTLQVFLNSLVQDSYAEGSEIIQPNGDQHLCIYAGWITTTKTNGKCPHPLDAPADSSDLKKRYNEYSNDCHNFSVSTTNQRDILVCNPSFFGKKLDGKPFCTVGNADAYNSSFNCLKEIDQYAKEQANKDNRQEIDVKNDILDGIIKESQKEKENYSLNSLEGMLLINYDTCMCLDDGDRLINNEYAKRMYNQRTCYAWLYQTQQILDRVNAPGACHNFKDIAYQKYGGDVLANMSDWAKKAKENLEKVLVEVNKDPSQYFSDPKVDNNWPNVRPPVEELCPIIFDDQEIIKAQVTNGCEDGYQLVSTKVIIGNKIERERADADWIFSADDKLDPKPKSQLRNEKRKDQMCFEMVNTLYTVNISLDGKTTSINIEPKAPLELADCTLTQEKVEKVKSDNGAEEDNNEEEEVMPEKDIPVVISVESENPTDLKMEDFVINWKINDESAKSVEGDKTKLFSGDGDKVTATILKGGKPFSNLCSLDVKKEDIPVVIPKPVDDEDKPTYTVSISIDKDEAKTASLIAIVKKGDKEANMEELNKEGISVVWNTSYVSKADEKENKDVEDTGTETTTTSISQELLDSHKDKLKGVKVDKKKVVQTVTVSIEKDGNELASASQEVSALKKEEEKSDKKNKKKSAPFVPNNGNNGMMAPIQYRPSGLDRGVK